jgi:hypothetical protein
VLGHNSSTAVVRARLNYTSRLPSSMTSVSVSSMTLVRTDGGQAVVSHTALLRFVSAVLTQRYLFCSEAHNLTSPVLPTPFLPHFILPHVLSVSPPHTPQFTPHIPTPHTPFPSAPHKTPHTPSPSAPPCPHTDRGRPPRALQAPPRWPRGRKPRGAS